MARLPEPGKDIGTWGTILNQYLLTEHNADGTHDVQEILQTPGQNNMVLVSHAGATRGTAWKTLTKQDVGLQNVTDDVQLKVSDLSTDTALTDNSDTKVPSQRAVKAYVDAAAQSTDKVSKSGDTMTGALLNTGSISAPTASEFGNGTQAFTAYANSSGVELGSKGATRIRVNNQVRFDSSSYTINTPPLVFRNDADDDSAGSKGSIIEWQQQFSAGDHDAGIATLAYKQWQKAGSVGARPTFNIPTTGTKRVSWILSHYDSPGTTGEDVHQHMNFETAKADMSTIITRLQISYGEDIALVGVPNSHFQVFDDKYLYLGSTLDASLRYLSASNTLDIAGSSNNSGKLLLRSTDAATKGKIIFGNDTGSGMIFEENTGRFVIGDTAADSKLHVETASDEVLFKIKSTHVGVTNSPMAVFEGDNANDKAFQTGTTTDAIKRYNFNVDGRMEWGSGSATRDTNLYRSAADTLRTDDKFIAGSLNIGASNAPASATASGAAGDIAYDSGFVYMCVAANTWRRSALTAW